MKKHKTIKTTARVIGAIPDSAYQCALWKVRLKAPYLPFHIDSDLSYATKEEADKVVEKWRRRKIVVQITK